MTAKTSRTKKAPATEGRAYEDHFVISPADPEFRVHRRFSPDVALAMPKTLNLPAVAEGETFLGAIVDVETTGLRADRHKIIELGIIIFRYDKADRIIETVDCYSARQDPGEPLDPKITEITGLTDGHLAGKSIDWAAVQDKVADCRIFIAHKAEFDRQFIEEHSPVPEFEKRPWACSYKEVEWQKLFPEVLANTLGAVLAGARREFFDGHRALDDCWATLRVITTPIAAPDGKALERQAFSELLASARTNTRRVWARNAPYDLKDELKLERGYHWHEKLRTWYLDLKDADALAAELKWLGEHGISAPEGLVTYVTAKDRWSVRA